MYIYGIVNCGSVKKAREFFESRQVACEFIDFKKNPPSEEKVSQWVEKAGIDIVINKKGTTYKKLQLKDKKLTQKEQIQLCVQNPSLIKRPVIEDKEKLFFGFDAVFYEENFL